MEHPPFVDVLSRKLTCPLKINGWKMYSLLNQSLFRGHDSCRGCMSFEEVGLHSYAGLTGTSTEVPIFLSLAISNQLQGHCFMNWKYLHRFRKTYIKKSIEGIGTSVCARLPYLM